MREVLETAVRVARASVPVLILGETGSGKEVLARTVHDASPRRDGPSSP
ncbi:MAG: sigma 54-interacting transcriptional regulator [Polyangiaceae bacterium]